MVVVVIAGGGGKWGWWPQAQLRPQAQGPGGLGQAPADYAKSRISFSNPATVG